MNSIDIPVGQRFSFQDINVEVVESNESCQNCCLRGSYYCGFIQCIKSMRKDGVNVIFKKVEG